MTFDASGGQSIWWLFPTLAALGGLAGGIFGSFFSKRGEIAAIQSQINTIVSQNERLVKSTEEIKSDISQRDWSKQRHWDMQREVAVEIMRLFGNMLRAASRLSELEVYYVAITDRKKDANKEDADKIREEYGSAREVTLAHLTTYWQLEEVSRLVFSDNVQSRMAAVKNDYQKLTASIWAHEVDNMKLGDGLKSLLAKQDALSKAIRIELGF